MRKPGKTRINIVPSVVKQNIDFLFDAFARANNKNDFLADEN